MNSIPSPEEKNSVSEVFATIRRYWFLELVVFGAIFGYSVYSTVNEKPVYQARGELIFKSARQSQGLTGVASVQQLTDSVAGNPLNTQALVLRSEPVVRRTIEALDARVDVATFIAPLFIEVVQGADVVRVSYLSNSPQNAAQAVNAHMQSYIDFDIQANREQTRAARKFIDTQLPKLQKELTDAESALRKFKEENRVYALDQEASSAITAVIDFDKQITATKSKLASTQSIIQDLRTRIGFNSDQAVALSKLADSKPVQETLAELQKIDTQLTTLGGVFTANHPSIIALNEQREPVQRLLQQRIEQTLGTSAVISARDLEVGTVERQLISDLVTKEIEKGGLQQELTTLNQTLINYQQRLVNIPRLQQQQLILERNLAISRTTYEELLKRFQEIQLSENQTIGNARILSTATAPSTPISPRIANNLLSGAALGAAIAVGIALFLNSRDTLVRSTEQIRGLTGFTILGVLPNFGKRFSSEQLPAFIRKNPNSIYSRIYRKVVSSQGYKNLKEGVANFKTAFLNAVIEPETMEIAVYVRDNPRSHISEAYRMLQTSLRFLSSDQPIQSVVITSSIPGEGKSTVSANLAVAIAQLGKKVLLIDADMRRPNQHKIWGMDNKTGLSDLLTNQVEDQEVINSILPKLDIIFGGPCPPSPLTLLESERMRALISKWSEDYDYILIDTPPLLAASDAMVLGKIANGVLIVARPEVINTAAIKRTRILLEQSEINVLGLVANDVSNEESAYYIYDYYDEQKKYIEVEV